jgi:hypothetical protein
MMPTDAEVIFWIVCGIAALLFVISVPCISDYLEYKRIRAMRN